ncbi:dihydrofolate reductase family protein [Streptomyces durmitorensis]|uniref:Dihydrofolate reductase family protein n=1 Tax=Streptomyces durmitorensis TaxID=319947 RepID=A0ABY4QAF6_9ACTN|nr:dihydrofolate reductase family protein [Streptomyces durmitorensis]UQT61978.1 dihydrofolate reductase family protein [Streptomyces durmitorensis]
MRKLTYFVAATLDGFIASPDSDYSMFLEGQDHGAWMLDQLPETIPTAMRQQVPGLAERGNQRFDTVVMGRGTYEHGVRDGFTSPFQHLRQYVVSDSMDSAPGAGVEVLSGDPLDSVRTLKKEDDGLGIWLCGGGKAAASLRDEIDEIIVKINPIVIGSGIPLFDSGYSPQRYDVVSGQVFDSGVTVMTYAKAQP